MQKEIKNYVMLGYDLMTKKVFGDKNDDRPIKLLLEIILGIKVNKVEILNNEVIDKPYIDKKNAVDLLIETDDNTMINVEINTNVSSLLIIRNLFYLFRIASRDLKPEEKYSKLKEHIQINFDFKGFHEFPIMVYSLKDDVSNVELTDRIKILRIDVPFFYNVMYNNDIERLKKFIGSFKLVRLDLNSGLRLAKFISLFYERNGLKASELVKGDVDMSHVYDKILENSDELIGAYDKESHDEFIREAYIKERTEEAIKEGLEKGLEQGIEQGKLEERKVIVLNMLNKDLSLEMISEISGLSIDEIEQIEKASN